MTPHLNRLNETVQMRGHNICFYAGLIKIIPNYHIVCFFTFHWFNSVHVAVEEKISVTAGRDGGLQGLELHGMIKLSINDSKTGRVVLGIANNDKKGAQLQVIMPLLPHPTL